MYIGNVLNVMFTNSEVLICVNVKGYLGILNMISE